MSPLRAFLVLSLIPALALAEPKPPTLRLPDGARPTHATVELTIDPAQDHFVGVEDLDLDVKGPLATLWLNADELTISKAEAKVGGKIIAARVLPQPKSFVGFAFATPLPAGKATLHVEWTGTLSTKDTSGASKQKEQGDVVRVHAVRGDRRAPRVPVLRRARLQGAVAAHARRARGAARRRQHADHERDRSTAT